MTVRFKLFSSNVKIFGIIYNYKIKLFSSIIWFFKINVIVSIKYKCWITNITVGCIYEIMDFKMEVHIATNLYRLLGIKYKTS